MNISGGPAVLQKSTKALTTKLIEVKPYKWVQVIDEGKRQIEQELMKNALSGALTKNSPILQGSNSLKSHLYKLWSTQLREAITEFQGVSLEDNGLYL